MDRAHLKTNFLMSQDPVLFDRIARVFGSPDDPIALVERRAEDLLHGMKRIIWEGDPQTFQFSYVSPNAEEILGYPCELWIQRPTFWSDTVVHDDDRHHAIAFCALATGNKEDHDFEYRAIASDGRIVWLHDIVKVIVGDKGVATKLRGLMIDVTELRA